MNEDAQNYYLPRYLDEPKRFILWTWDELFALGLPLGIFWLLTSQLLIALFAGLSAYLALKKLKGRQGTSFIKTLIYWYLPPLFRLRFTPPSFIRCYLG